MSKYYKAESVKDEIVRVLEHTDCKDSYIDDVLRAIENLPTIEAGTITVNFDKEQMKEIADEALSRVISEDAISREYLEEQLQQIEDITAMVHIDLGENPYDETEEITMPISTVRKIFKDAPSVIPQPKEGEWLLDGRCSECLANPLTTHKNYCPHCGAKMKGASR